MKIQTTRFGNIEINETSLINFPNGIIGFEDLKQFYIINKERTDSFWWLQSLEKLEIAFLIADPRCFLSDYNPTLTKEDMHTLQISDPTEVEFGVILTIPEDPRETTANLLAPIAINMSNKTATQIIMRDNRCSARYMIMQPVTAGSSE